jgi:L-amino acid N-acyltransferase YncA
VERIRVASVDDTEAILDIYAPFCLPDAIASFELAPPSLEEMRKRITSILTKYPFLVYEVDKKVVGYASASQYHVRAAYDWSVTVSIYLLETARGLGVGRKLYTALFQILRKQNFFNAYAGITIPNPASIGLHQSMGFVEVGLTPKVGYKAGQWLDVALLCLELQPHVADPRAPISFPELSGDLLISG